MARPRIGIWLVGARGNVATTSIVGLTALQQAHTVPVGLVSELPQFSSLQLPAWNDFVVGGHEIRRTPLVETAADLGRQNRAMEEVVAAVRPDLLRCEENIRPGTLINAGPAIEELADGRWKRRRETPAAAVKRIQRDLRAFVRDQQLQQLVVVHVASTEPTFDTAGLPGTWAELQKLLEHPRKCPLGASSLYAIAALDAGYPFINFTPSLGSDLEAIRELAVLRDTCHMGQDGKTGETLLKSVLAPMFARRNLEVMSWVGHNIFGNLDGRVLESPENKQTKVTSKDRLLHEILGYQPQTLVSIEYIESMGDWKTAWDHIHFRGFLGTPMTLQLTWQGCDSLLAAPLVLDLVRFTSAAHQRGARGLLPQLASFFKSPMGTSEHDFGRQFQMLLDWAHNASR